MDQEILSMNERHKYCTNNRKYIEQSENSGCFFCCEIYPAKSIFEFVDDDQTALCPKCGIDSVIPDVAVNLSTEMLNKMRKFWFY